MDPDVAGRVLRRGGKWGVRALRVAMLSADGDDDGVLSGVELRKAFEKYGVPLTAAQAPSSFDVETVMNSVVPAIDQATFAAIVQSYDAVHARLTPAGAGGTGAPLVLREVCAVVGIDHHPDVSSGALATREALFLFYSMWGLPRLSDTVSRDLWVQFHAELAAGFVHARDFVALLQQMWGFKLKTAAASAADLRPPSAAELKKLFDDVDGNRSGKLSLAEVDLACVRLWPHFNKKPAIIRAFKLADNGRDGALDRKDFARFLQYLPKYVEVLDALVAYDTSRDGYLDEQEFINGKAAFGLGNQTDGQVRLLFRDADANRGGKLTLEELAVFLAKRAGDKEMGVSTNQFAAARPAPKLPGAQPASGRSASSTGRRASAGAARR